MATPFRSREVPAALLPWNVPTFLLDLTTVEACRFSRRMSSDLRRTEHPRHHEGEKTFTTKIAHHVIASFRCIEDCRHGTHHGTVQINGGDVFVKQMVKRICPQPDALLSAPTSPHSRRWPPTTTLDRPLQTFWTLG